ncbi:MAG: PEGA domain-containing protein, partial [Polyangiales bacterium]
LPPAQPAPAPPWPPQALPDAVPARDSFSLLDTLDDVESPYQRTHVGWRSWLLIVGATLLLFGTVLIGRLILHQRTPTLQPVAAPTAAAEVADLPQPAAAESALPELGLLEPNAAELLPKAASERAHKRSVSRASNTSSQERLAEPNALAGATPSQPSDLPENDDTRTETDPRSSAAASGMGSLRINSRPWSQVYIEGKLVGTTPQRDIPLPAGTHTVHLINPELDMRKTLLVHVAPGESITRVETLDD